VLDIQRLRRGGGGLRKSLIFNDLCGLSCGSRICANCRDSVHHFHLELFLLPPGDGVDVAGEFDAIAIEHHYRVALEANYFIGRDATNSDPNEVTDFDFFSVFVFHLIYLTTISGKVNPLKHFF
jgi:hypothetical protein